jgi:hypothetical protein
MEPVQKEVADREDEESGEGTFECVRGNLRRKAWRMYRIYPTSPPDDRGGHGLPLMIINEVVGSS